MGDEGWSGGGSDKDGGVSAPSKKHGGLNLLEKAKPHLEQGRGNGPRTVMDSKKKKET